MRSGRRGRGQSDAWRRVSTTNCAQSLDAAEAHNAVKGAGKSWPVHGGECWRAEVLRQCGAPSRRHTCVPE